MPAVRSASVAAVSRRERNIRYGLVFLLLCAVGVLLAIPLTARRAAISTKSDPAEEIIALASALEAYRAEVGEYPPNFSAGDDTVRNHLQTRFPNMAADEELPPYVDAAEALVFWLGGFSKDSKHPITGPGGPLDFEAPRRPGFYEFDSKRLFSTAYGKHVYLPPGVGRTEPYVYFNTRGAGKLIYPDFDSRIEPYRESESTYAGDVPFQIISAGEDDKWGGIPGPRYPAGPFPPQHADNRANFAPDGIGK